MLVVNWWAERELNSHSRHYEYPALPLSYQPVFGARNGTRTRIALRPADFKSAVYTIPPLSHIFECFINLVRRERIELPLEG